MGSKAIVVLVGLFLAAFFLISSEVAARDLAETSNHVNTNPRKQMEPPLMLQATAVWDAVR
ncbi:hypothetical protein CASFOL_032582 [Castilleja foliolosa]|uniref:Uncharacterized protein n=1 Tax=Castilleja foliolosa TaxID=1961234 RepID=A0ABD3C1X9_9LAMI